MPNFGNGLGSAEITPSTFGGLKPEVSHGLMRSGAFDLVPKNNTWRYQKGKN